MGAKTKITFHVVDYEGKSVSNATMRVVWSYDYTNKSKVLRTQTDEKGLVVIEEKSRGTFIYFAEKDGYYQSEGKHSFYMRGETRIKDGRWEPWNPTVEIVLKEKRSPMPMFSGNEKGGFSIPRDTSVGFDFEKGDPVKPYGNGEYADVVFRFSSNAPLKFTPARTNSLAISTMNEDEGFIMMTKDGQSELQSEYECPEQGYIRDMEFFFAYTHAKVDNRRFPSGKYLLFRARAVHDEEGRLTSARYGKIYHLLHDEDGDRPGFGFIQIDYRFNPEENNRNVEYDGKNLTTGKRTAFWVP